MKNNLCQEIVADFYHSLHSLKYAVTLLFLLVGTVFASETYPQTAKVTVSGSKTTIKQILNEIEKQTDYLFVYNENEVNVRRTVNVNAKDKRVSDVLDQIFSGSSVRYAVEGNNIMLMGQTAGTNQQAGKLKGKIKDVNGESIIGANITVKGTTIGTITDIDGNFTLDVPANSVLQVSYIGYITQEIKVTSLRDLAIVLKEDTETLEEVVVVGYGTQKKANLTGAVSSVSVADMENRPITNASNMLQGTAAGVYALQQSGQPGADGAVINIRGVGTLNNSDPLVLIDGFPGSMSDVDASEINSISVLKDAASAAIYGNRAANGVILITTKKGAAGKMAVSYSGYFGVQEATALPKTLNSYQYATLYNEACVNTGMQEKYSAEAIQKYKDGTDPMYPSIDYFDVYYDKANMQNHRITVTGGTDNLQYAFMMGYLDQDGILVGTSYRKSDFRANIDSYLLNKKLRFTTRLSGNFGAKKEPTNIWDAKWYATNAPILPLTNNDGLWMSVNGERNFYGEIKSGSLRKDKRHTFNGQVEGEYTIIDGLSAQLTYGYNFEHNDASAFNANVTLANADGSTKTLMSSLNRSNATNYQTLLTGLLKFNKTFGKHNVGAMAGYSEEYFEWKSMSGYRTGFVNNTQPELNLGDASSMTNNSSHYALGLRSYFGRLNYVYDNKYLFEANLRYDGSSRFADGNKWGSFPSFSAGWVLSEEKFMESTRDWLDMLKIRASWGKLGNQNINSYYVGSDVLSTGYNYSLGGALQSGVAVGQLINKSTSWETTTQTDLGVDFAFLNHFNLSLDYFVKKTDNILMQTPIPLTMGNLSAPYINAGKVENKGIEATLTYRNTFQNGLKLNTSLNLSHIKNKIVDLNGASPIINGSTAQVEGQAIHSFYGYIQDGIYQIDDFTWQNNSDPSIPHTQRNYELKPGVVKVSNFNATPGDIKYRDLNGDGIVTMDKDRTIIGKQFPDLSYALTCNLEWKNFDLSMFWQGVAGIDGYTYYEIATCFSGFANLGDWWLDRWTPEKPSNVRPKVSHDTVRTGIHSTYYMEDASYLRLKNIELGYTFDKKVLKGLGSTKVRLYGSIQNALTITNYKGFDPEQTVGETRAQAFPQVRIYTVGLNVNF